MVNLLRRYLVALPITLWRRLRRRTFSIRELNLLTYPLAGGSATDQGAGEGVEALTKMVEPLRRFCRARYSRWSDDVEAAVRGYERRFAHGDVCFALCEGGQITCHLWGSERTLLEPELERYRPLAEGEVALYDIYVLSPYRGGRRHGRVFPYFAAYYAARGKTAIRMVVDGDNIPSLRANRRIGFRRVTLRLWQLNLLGFTFLVHREEDVDVEAILGIPFRRARIVWDVIRRRSPRYRLISSSVS